VSFNFKTFYFQSITGLSHLDSARFGYSLANGSVGVYDKNQRNWRIKSRNLAMDIHSFDINADGVPEFVTGWSSGKCDARNCVTGEVVFKCNLESSVAGLANVIFYSLFFLTN
jgi:Bardet-Biedl syndrome 2 protein